MNVWWCGVHYPFDTRTHHLNFCKILEDFAAPASYKHHQM